MGNVCSSGGCNNGLEAGKQYEGTIDNSRLALDKVNILEFERRVKQFAHPINKGRVSVDQLVEAFRDVAIFAQLRNPFSVVYKLLLSPFFR